MGQPASRQPIIMTAGIFSPGSGTVRNSHHNRFDLTHSLLPEKANVETLKSSDVITQCIVF